VSDQDLLDRLRAGDQAAFDTLFRTHYARLVGVAQAMLHDRAAAEEIAQEVMLELWRRRETLTVETSLRAYLFRATRNRSLNQIRRQRVERRGEPFAAPESSIAPPADSHLVEQEIDAALRRALEHLPARCREVFELSRVHGLKYAEIARVLEISVKTVEAQMGKALRIMREQLAPWLPQNDEL
jgi:RNA polymerase sigma-70 factor (ECF subfamily)